MRVNNYSLAKKEKRCEKDYYTITSCLQGSSDAAEVQTIFNFTPPLKDVDTKCAFTDREESS
jgi:hypothetical protein